MGYHGQCHPIEERKPQSDVLFSATSPHMVKKERSSSCKNALRHQNNGTRTELFVVGKKTGERHATTALVLLTHLDLDF
jgi:hypothetical protein